MSKNVRQHYVVFVKSNKNVAGFMNLPYTKAPQDGIYLDIKRMDYIKLRILYNCQHFYASLRYGDGQRAFSVDPRGTLHLNMTISKYEPP